MELRFTQVIFKELLAKLIVKLIRKHLGMNGKAVLKELEVCSDDKHTKLSLNLDVVVETNSLVDYISKMI